MMSFDRQAVRIAKMGIDHAQAFGATIHLRDKSFLAAIEMFSDRHAGIIG